MSKDNKIKITWNSKDYYFDGPLAKYFIFCGEGFIYGGMIGSIVGAVVGAGICIASPIIVGAVAFRALKYFKYILPAK